MTCEMDEFDLAWEAMHARIKDHDQFKHFGVRNYSSNYKSCGDGVMFSCALTYKGSVVATAYNNGTGGPDVVDFTPVVAAPISSKQAKLAWQELLDITEAEYEPHAVVLDCILTAAGK